MTFTPPGSTSTWPMVATAPAREGRVTDPLDLDGRRDERVLAAGHRRRPRMPRPPLEDELPAGVADDSGHDPERHAGVREHGPLLDVELEIGARHRPAARNERPAPDAPDLLAAEHHHRPGADALHGFDRRDDAERAVEAAAPRDAVQVRARPDVVPLSRASDEVAEASTSTSSPASSSHAAATRCASSSAGEACGRFAPGPPPMA